MQVDPSVLVAWSCKSAFLVKYWVRYLGTRLFKHLKTRKNLCIFLLEARFNQLSRRKVSFEVFFRNARFLHVGAVALCNTPLRFSPTQHQRSQITAARVKCIPVKRLPAWGMIVYETKALASYWPCCLHTRRDLSKKGSHLKQHLNG